MVVMASASHECRRERGEHAAVTRTAIHPAGNGARAPVRVWAESATVVNYAGAPRQDVVSRSVAPSWGLAQRRG